MASKSHTIFQNRHGSSSSSSWYHSWFQGRLVEAPSISNPSEVKSPKISLQKFNVVYAFQMEMNRTWKWSFLGPHFFQKPSRICRFHPFNLGSVDGNHKWWMDPELEGPTAQMGEISYIGGWFGVDTNYVWRQHKQHLLKKKSGHQADDYLQNENTLSAGGRKLAPVIA